MPWLSFTPVSGVVAPDDSDEVSVTLDATGLPGGVYTADIVVASNIPNMPTVTVPVELTVTGIAIIAVSDTMLDFGGAFLGYPEMLTFAVTNEGTAMLTVSDIVASNPQLSVSPSSFDLAPGRQQVVNVSLMPSTVGPVSATLVISHNGHDQGDISIDVTADIIAPPVASVSVDSLSGMTTQGETVIDTVTLSNMGGSDLIWSISITGPTSASMQAQTAEEQGGEGVLSTRSAIGVRIVRSDPHALGSLDVLYHGDREQ